MSCIFCQIVEGTIPANVLFKDDKVMAFRDIHPQAPVHIIIVPIEHFANLTDIKGDDFGLIAYIFSIADRSGQVGRHLRTRLSSGGEFRP